MAFPKPYWFELKNLEWKQAASNRWYFNAIKNAKEKGDHQNARELELVGSQLNDTYRDSIDSEVTKHLTHIANKLYLAIPATNNHKYWRSSEETALLIPILNPEGIHYLSEAIRAEKQKRRESWLALLKALGIIFTILTGLVGAITGLVSLYFRNCITIQF